MSVLRAIPLTGLLMCLLTAGCGASSSETAAPSTSGAAAPASAAAPTAVAPAPGSPGDDWQRALGLRSCYGQITDVTEDPLGQALPCDDARAGWRLVAIQAASAGDCPANQALESEKPKGGGADAVAPSLCLEPVTH